MAQDVVRSSVLERVGSYLWEERKMVCEIMFVMFIRATMFVWEMKGERLDNVGSILEGQSLQNRMIGGCVLACATETTGDRFGTVFVS